MASTTSFYFDSGSDREQNAIEGQRGAEKNGRGDRRGLPLPHLRDLQAEAEHRVRSLDPNITMGRLLRETERSTKSAGTLLQYRRPDQAYTEYVCAMELITKVIPRHKELVFLQSDRGSLHRLHKDMIKELSAMSDRFDEVKMIIEEDNRRSGVTPRILNESGGHSKIRPSSAMDNRDRSNSSSSARWSTSSGQQNLATRPSSYIDGAHGLTFAFQSDGQHQTVPSSRPGDHPTSLRPAIRPKPANLHGAAVNGRSSPRSSTDTLNERFSRLRSTGTGSTGKSDISLHSSTLTSPTASVTMPSPSQYHIDKSFTSVTTSATSSQWHRNGTAVPSLPPKLPLNTAMATALPKAPDPIYSPARNMPTPGGIDPPRSTARSLNGTGGRTNLQMSSASQLPPGASEDTDSYFPNANTGERTTVRRNSIHSLKETQISAERLYDMLKLYSVFLVDCRSREEYDAGHIYNQYVACIEPTALREGMSANELQDALVLSPDNEQALFARRHEFDFVVLYDQSTPSNRYLTSSAQSDSQRALKCITAAMLEFNHGNSPLQRPPILLMGGLMAWTDLLGQSALLTSSTSSTKKLKAARPIKRVPPAGTNSQIFVKKKRREYNPLDPEEERKWAERARAESIAIGEATVHDAADAEEEAVQIYRTTEEFLRRYPDISPIEKESMIAPPSRPAPVPNYPAVSIPAAPSRPAPAVPRTAYRGAHDREATSQMNGARGQQLASYVPQNEMPHNIRLPRTGLINFGSTCYMNSTIQCLNATWPLSRDFRTYVFRRYVQQDNWKGSKGIVSENLANLINALWKGDVQACRPSTFRSFCARLNREWGTDRQQDAKEFYDFLIDFLHEDLNTNWNNKPPHVLSELEESLREKTPKPFASKIEWARFSKRDRSIISELFAGQHASRLKCTVCQTTSTTYEAFYSLSVEIPRSGSTTIQKCLQSFCSEELLSGDEVWKCPRCKKEREATKQITLTRAPRYLVVHFKRFSASHGEAARKVRTPIDFPLENLDLEPFMLPQPSADEYSQAIKDFGVRTLRTDCVLDQSLTPPYLYNCYAVMRHLGTTLHSGHYIAMAKDQGRGCWRKFNDDRVTDFDPAQLREADRLQNEQAYIVFFERDLSAVKAPGLNGVR